MERLPQIKVRGRACHRARVLRRPWRKPHGIGVFGYHIGGIGGVHRVVNGEVPHIVMHSIS
jgi:hypothetical protein